MIKYEDYDLKCPLLSSAKSDEADSFIRSTFEYLPRQRGTYTGTTKSSFAVVLKFDQVKRFKQFWLDLNNGADRFEADFIIHADDNVGKVLRFIAPPRFTGQGKNIYKIETVVEVLSFGTPKENVCPAYPYNTSYPSNTSYPCG